MSYIYHHKWKYSPEYLIESLQTDTHRYNTLNRKCSFKRDNVKSHGQYSFFFNAPKLWNTLPESIKLNESKSNFKLKCKKHLMWQLEQKANNIYEY